MHKQVNCARRQAPNNLRSWKTSLWVVGSGRTSSSSCFKQETKQVGRLIPLKREWGARRGLICPGRKLPGVIGGSSPTAGEQSFEDPRPTGQPHRLYFWLFCFPSGYVQTLCYVSPRQPCRTFWPLRQCVQPDVNDVASDWSWLPASNLLAGMVG